MLAHECETRITLVEYVSIVCSRYAAAVEWVGVLLRSGVQHPFDEADIAWTAYLEARRALEKHEQEHGCGPAPHCDGEYLAARFDPNRGEFEPQAVNPEPFG
jgi:hypothetical protein